MDVILVDENDVAVGSMEKMEAHQKAALHRAFSIFIFNDKEGMLLQKRSAKKYHSPGLWTNACCSHPQPGEDTLQAAQKRLQEELGFTTDLTNIFSFTYKADFDNGLAEHEFDHVYIGNYTGDIFPDAEEVSDYCFMSMGALKNSLQTHPQKYTEWFKIAFPKLEEYILLNSINS